MKDVPTSRQSVLAAALQRIGEFSLDRFEDRLKLQKTVYLLQVFGFYLGYPFNWYLYGPYSPDLTRDAFEVVPQLGRYEPISFRDRQTEAAFDRFISFLGEKKDDPKWLELVASLHMLKKLYQEQDRPAILRKVSKKAPRLSQQDRQVAWDHLRNYGLV